MVKDGWTLPIRPGGILTDVSLVAVTVIVYYASSSLLGVSEVSQKIVVPRVDESKRAKSVQPVVSMALKSTE